MTEKATLNYLSWIGLPAPAVDPNHAVRKKEVDDAVSELQTQINTMQGGGSGSKKVVSQTFNNSFCGTTYTLTHNIGSLNYYVDLWFINSGQQVNKIKNDGDYQVYKNVHDVFTVKKNLNNITIVFERGHDINSANFLAVVREY